VNPFIRPIAALLLAVPFAQACGTDPILARADEERAEEPTAGQPAPGQAASPPPGAAAQPAPGQPGEPSPGDPSQPPPGAPDQPQPGVPDQPQPGAPVVEIAPGEPQQGPTITLVGEVRFADYQGGRVRVDVFDGDQKDFSARPSVVGWAELDAPGPFELKVPSSAERVWISAFNDANRDGKPGHEDPTGFFADNPVALGERDVSGIVIDLVLEPPPEGE
jgi:hypothetical protein